MLQSKCILYTIDNYIPSQLCKLDPTFLDKPVAEWDADESFRRFSFLVNGFTPVNDAGERAVKFASDFNGAITQDAKQHKAMLQGVQQHRRAYPKPTKR